MVANFSATILVYPFTRQMCSPLSKFRYSTIVQADQKNKETPDFKGFLKKIERVMGIEPTYPAWKAGVLPLNYTRTACCLCISVASTKISIYDETVFVNTKFKFFLFF